MIFYPTTRYLDKEIQGIESNSTRWGQDYTWDHMIHRRVVGPHQSHHHTPKPIDPANKGQSEDMFEWLGDFLASRMLKESGAQAKRTKRDTSSK